MFELDSHWHERTLSLPSGVVIAIRERKESSPAEGDMLIGTHLKEIAVSGGALLRRFGDTPALRPITSITGMIGYTGEAPEMYLWYIPRCSFEDTLELLDVVGFPKSYVRSDPELVRASTKRLIKELAQNRQLALTVIGPEHVSYERIDGEPFTRKEANRVLDFNREHFNVDREDWELREYRRLFRTKGLVVIGAL